MMSRRTTCILGLTPLLSLSLTPDPSIAGLSSYNVTHRPIEEVELKLGGQGSNQLLFEPSTLFLTRGTLTKLRLTNPSKLNHYFTAPEFADKIFSVLVQVGEKGSKVEVKGKVQELELDAGQTLTWILVPMKAGTYPLRCSIKGHAEGGMVATIVVKEA